MYTHLCTFTLKKERDDEEKKELAILLKSSLKAWIPIVTSMEKIMTLKNFILKRALEKGGTLNVDIIYREHYRHPKTKILQVSLSRVLKKLRDESLIKRSSLKRSRLIELTEKGRERANALLSE